MTQKVILVTPKQCDDECSKVLDLFKGEIDRGEILQVQIGTEEGDRIAKTFGLMDIKEFKVVTVSDVSDVVDVEVQE